MNKYWEEKLTNKNDNIFLKLQDDDNKLRDFIQDKYVRKKYCNPKKKDPMGLLFEGKDLEQNSSETEEEQYI